MNIINIHKDKANTIWKNDETFLCVFDNNNNLLADYDFCTGLKLMQDDKEMTIFINDENLVSGNWVFFATKINTANRTQVKERIKVSGFKGGSLDKFDIDDEYPWSNNCGPGKYISKKERDDRLSVCKSCPLFDLNNMTCTVDEKMVLQSTKYEDSYCPKEKWGDKAAVLAEISERMQGSIIMPQAIKIDQQEQDEFEAELEKYLEAL